MSARSECYGRMFPDFTQLRKNTPLESPAFSALIVSHGIGVQGRTLQLKPDGWGQCVACADYRTCYDLSLAQLLMNTVLTHS